MKKIASDRHAIAGAFIFLLLAAFAVFSTLLVLLGAQAYSGIVARAEKASAQRILVNYPLNKVRSGALRDAVTVEEREGISVLALSQQVDGVTYETLIYCYAGSLRELFYCPEDGAFYPPDGQALPQAEFFRPTLLNGYLSFEVGAGDEVYQAGCRLRLA